MNGRFSVIWYTTNIKQFSKKYLTEHTKTINRHSLSATKSKTKLRDTAYLVYVIHCMYARWAPKNLAELLKELT